MTKQQIMELSPGSWVQESLSTGYGRGKKRYGRPREVLSVVKTWRTNRGKYASHFRVRFGKACFHWTAIEGDTSYLHAPKPSVEDLEAWALGAEASPLEFE